ncbi:hypothetical protein [Microbacterium suaedae]|uniref:hypothetical protein n=1 Tax=Microbacterium suaedae TaxID=2067813 RepID=UPI000DA1BFEB|nr:hypothetical protein [Microbacterium suaedae]
MSLEDRQGIPARIEAAVRDVPGVAEVYPVGSLVSRAVDVGARLLGVRDDEAPRVRVEEGISSVRVEVAIGVRVVHGAGSVARDVHDAIRAAVGVRNEERPEIRLTVVHVDDELAPGEVAV